jgi:hypothetical protein
MSLPKWTKPAVDDAIIGAIAIMTSGATMASGFPNDDGYSDFSPLLRRQMLLFYRCC